MTEGKTPKLTQPNVELVGKFDGCEAGSGVVPYLWSTYVVYYLLRFSLAGSILFLMEERRMNIISVGWVYSCFFISYAIGQLASGYIADHFSPQKLLRFGLIGSVLANTLSYLCLEWEGHYYLMIIWTLNGLFQSMGWSPITRILSWHHEKQYHFSASIVSTAFICGASLSWLLSAALSRFGPWQLVFLVPAAIGFLLWLLTANLLFDVPPNSSNLRIREGLRILTRSRSAIVSFIGINTVRYYIFDWLPILLRQETGDTPSAVMIKIFLYPVSGLIGVLLGWNFILRKKMQSLGRIWSLSLLMMFILTTSINSFMTYIAPYIIFVLIGLGATTAGVHFYTVAIAPGTIGGKANIATTTGLIESSGYLGQAIGNIVIAWILSSYGRPYLSWFFVMLGVIVFIANPGGRNENRSRA